MNKTLILVLVLSFFFVNVLCGEEKPATSGGRYQLLQGNYTLFFFSPEKKGGSQEIKTIFRIDTKTGKTYYFLSSPRDGYQVDYWCEIKEFDEACAGYRAWAKKPHRVP